MNKHNIITDLLVMVIFLHCIIFACGCLEEKIFKTEKESIYKVLRSKLQSQLEQKEQEESKKTYTVNRIDAYTITGRTKYELTIEDIEDAAVLWLAHNNLSTNGTIIVSLVTPLMGTIRYGLDIIVVDE